MIWETFLWEETQMESEATLLFLSLNGNEYKYTGVGPMICGI